MAETYKCPACELRFALRPEMEDHMRTSHARPVPDDVPPPAPVPSGVVTVALDPARPAGAALEVAAAFARQAGMAVELVAAPAAGLPTAPYLTARSHELAALGVPALPWRELPGTSVADAVVDHIAATAPDIVCLAGHGRGPVVEAVVGSISEQVVRRSSAPVLLVGPHARAWRHVDRVIACLDGTAVAEQGAAVGADVARRLGADMEVLEVLERHGDDGAGAETPYLHALAERLAVPTARQVSIDARRPAHAIVRHAGAGTGELLVLGTAARHGFDAWALGSVATEVVRHARCPVLLVTAAAADRLGHHADHRAAP